MVDLYRNHVGVLTPSRVSYSDGSEGQRLVAALAMPSSSTTSSGVEGLTLPTPKHGRSGGQIVSTIPWSLCALALLASTGHAALRIAVAAFYRPLHFFSRAK